MGTLKGFPIPSRDGALRRSRQAPHAGRDSADSRLRESRSKLGERARLGFNKRARSPRHQKVSGGNSGGATPDPISNSEVKSSRAHGTAGETLWESRSPPGLFLWYGNPQRVPIPSRDGARPAQPAGSPRDYGRKASAFLPFLFQGKRVRPDKRDIPHSGR